MQTWIETITVYNKHNELDENGRKHSVWKRTVLTGCFWALSQNRNLTDTTTKRESNSVTVRVPFNSAYVPPADWDALANTGKRFTLASGDIIVRGSVSDKIGDGMSPAELLQKHARSGACTIQIVRENLIIHPKHYSVVGVS